MYAHLRIYTINKGMMQDWLNVFNKKIIPLLEESGIKVESSWTNEEKSQFIWIRSYGKTLSDIEEKEKKFYGSDWWVKNVDFVRSHLAHRDILTIESI